MKKIFLSLTWIKSCVRGGQHGKNTEFPSKNVRKNSLLFLDGVYKNSIYVQKIHAHVEVVPFLHLSSILANMDTRKKGLRRVRSAFAFFNRRTLLRDARYVHCEAQK